jgi:methyltransferase (TIGR00027 family)
MGAASASTGVGPMAMVAIEQSFPAHQRIVDDKLAAAILPFGGRLSLKLMRLFSLERALIGATERAFPGLWAGLMCRKRHVDARLAELAGAIDTVVNLGAGFDTRLYRLPLPAGVLAWEVDQPENLRPKARRLEHLFGEIPPHVRLVAIDFDREDLGSVLRTNGYAPGSRTLFIWEAVTQYLTEAGIRATFAFLTTAASGSRLAFTYVLRDFIEGRNRYGQERLYERYVTREKIWRSGFDPAELPRFLESYGWHLIEDVDYAELAARYVAPTARALASTPIERIVFATKI